MARRRSIKPEFFKDKRMAALGSQVALVYQALWCTADDGGVAKADPDLLKGEMFYRWEEYGLAVLTTALQRLSDAQRVKIYAVGDDLFAEIPTLLRHNPINRPSDFRHPRGGERVTDVRAWVSGQHSLLAHDRLSEQSSPVAVAVASSVAGSNANAVADAAAAAIPDRVTAKALDAATREVRIRSLTQEGREALTRLERASQSPDGLRAEVAMILAGERPNVPSDPRAVSLGLVDMSTNGVRPTANALRSFVRKAVELLTAAPAGGGGAGNEYQTAARRARQRESRT